LATHADDFYPSVSKRHVLSKECWDEILENRKTFLQSNTDDQRSYPRIAPAILASWIRSRRMKVDPYSEVIGQRLSEDEHQKVLEESRLLIDIARPLVDIFKDLVDSSDYVLELVNPNGVILLQQGDLGLHPAYQGTVFNEHTMGTNAHNLSMALGRPVQLLGPEHNCEALQNIIASAAPIQDESGEIIASLILTHPLSNPPWDNGFQKLISHTLGMITAIAVAIETQIELQTSYDHLRVANDTLTIAYDTLEGTLAFIDEGIITIDHTGRIIRSNHEGLRIFQLKPDNIGNHNILEFLDSQSKLLTLVNKGENVDVEESILSGNDEQPYFVNIRPIWNLHTNQVNVAVLRLNHAAKINAMVASRSGTIARFNFEDIIGESKQIRGTIALARRFANSPEGILLSGESGTGKELFAQAIHNNCRTQGPFMAVNCAAMPRNLIESELFGYEGGSFTGAERGGRPGKIELAHGGTLFLDEIGDMPYELQAVLLRVLEDKQVMRVGGRRYKKVDFRVIAATNRNLREMVKENLFREDLFFRLSVLTICLPPLRDRKNDLEVLTRYFIECYCKRLGWPVPQITPAAQKMINEYNWPGNARELENAMHYAINTMQNETIDTQNLPDHIMLDKSPVHIFGLVAGSERAGEVLSLRKLEKEAIDLALLHSHNSVSRAAELLEISQATLYRKLKGYNIKEPLRPDLK
jgi:transcriptional regulator with PAS, ATPase and Fis domain